MFISSTTIGVCNDVVGWTLLALSVALVNAGTGLTAVYILITCVGYAIFLLLFVKHILLWVAHQTGSIENGPTLFFMTITILLLFGSAFFTDVIGVHAIFGSLHTLKLTEMSADQRLRIKGAFLTGIIVPREGGLTIALTEKLEDMVSIIFLPLVKLFIPMHLSMTHRCTCFIVLHPIRPLYRPRTTKQWFVWEPNHI